MVKGIERAGPRVYQDFDFFLSFPRSIHHLSRITHDKGWEVERGMRIRGPRMVTVPPFPPLSLPFDPSFIFSCRLSIVPRVSYFSASPPQCHDHSIPHAAPFPKPFPSFIYLFIGLVCLDTTLLPPALIPFSTFSPCI